MINKKIVEHRLIQSILDKEKWVALGVFLLAILLYANTVNHEFTQDDAIVIYDNAFTTQGISGISPLIQNDTFKGFFQDKSSGDLVSGGRFRPFTLVVFASIWELFGNNPRAFHSLVILIYGLLCALLYLLILKFDFPKNKKEKTVFALGTTLIFTLHPIHTEVVANVKGLDEIVCLLWGLVAMWTTLSYVKRGKLIYLMLSSFAFFLALLSKENSISFLFLIPLSAYLFLHHPVRKRLISTAITLFVTFGLYFLIRNSIIGSELGDAPLEMMNNPFIKVFNGQYLSFNIQERISSIVLGLGKYIQLLFFPHPLTHDYYPRYFDVVTFKNPVVVLSFVMNFVLMAIALLGINKNSFTSYCILFFYISIFIVSNILFPIGTHISERFLFVPSLGFALFGGMVLKNVFYNSKMAYQWLGIFSLIFILYGIKTVARNQIWKNDFTLFNTDVKISGTSAKVRNAAGGSLIARAMQTPDTDDRNQMLSRAVEHLNKAIQIHPNYKNAWLLLGNAYFYSSHYDSSTIAYETALRIDPGYDEAFQNLHLAYREGGRQAGSVERNIEKAKRYLLKALNLNKQDYETLSLLGIAYGNDGDHFRAIEFFEKAVIINPKNARAYVNLGQAYLNAGNEDESRINLQKAVQIDPEALKNR